MVLADSSNTNVVSNLLDDAQHLILKSFFGRDEPPNSDNPIHAAYRHHFSTRGGGTRIRLTHHCAKHLGIGESDCRRLAAAVECLHNASLVQDDLQDYSTFRRGQPSVVAKFGKDVALGLTDSLITTAFVCVSEISNHSVLPDLIGQIHRAVSETAEGQTTELSSGFGSQSIDARLTAAKKKSGPLFALALELPLIVAGNQESLPDAHEAACLFGLGYQVLDDLKDQRSDAENEINGNLVLAMMSDSPDISAETRAIELAQRLLHNAILKAEDLPQGVGTPLIDLVKDLLLQIDFFASAT